MGEGGERQEEEEGREIVSLSARVFWVLNDWDFGRQRIRALHRDVGLAFPLRGQKGTACRPPSSDPTDRPTPPACSLPNPTLGHISFVLRPLPTREHSFSVRKGRPSSIWGRGNNEGEGRREAEGRTPLNFTTTSPPPLLPLPTPGTLQEEQKKHRARRENAHSGPSWSASSTPSAQPCTDPESCRESPSSGKNQSCP